MKNIINLLIVFLLVSSCATTKIDKVFKCDNRDCIEKFMGPPSKISDNGESGKILEYSEPNGANSKFWVDNSNKVYDSETTYVLRRPHQATVYTTWILIVLGAGLTPFLIF